MPRLVEKTGMSLRVSASAKVRDVAIISAAYALPYSRQSSIVKANAATRPTSKFAVRPGKAIASIFYISSASFETIRPPAGPPKLL